MRQKLTYTLIAVALGYAMASALQTRLHVNPYMSWLFSFTLISFSFYGWDKRMAELDILKGWRVPEFTLVILPFLGGALGTWIGRVMFHHKTNIKKHPWMFVLLILATLFNIAVLVRVIMGPELVSWPPDNWIQFTK